MKKLAIIIPSLRGGGAERVMLNIASNMDKSKYQVQLIVLKKEGAYISELPNSLDVVDLNVDRVRYGFSKLVKALNHFQPQYVISTLGHLNLALIMIRHTLKSNPQIIVREANTPSLSKQKLPFLKRNIFLFLYKNLYPKADLIIAQCNEMRDDIIDTYDIEGDKVRVIHNPVDIEVIKGRAQEFNPYAESDKTNIIAVGRLTYQKGFDILIEAMEKVLLEIPNTSLEILGHGELEETLKNQIIKLKLEEHVKIIGFKDNPYPHYKHSDLFVLSSRWEGFPNVVLEALACGVKVVSTNCKSGPKEILGNNEYGYLAEVGNPSSLADVIIRALNTKNRSKDRAIKYNITNIIGEYESIL